MPLENLTVQKSSYKIYWFADVDFDVAAVADVIAEIVTFDVDSVVNDLLLIDVTNNDLNNDKNIVNFCLCHEVDY